MPRRAVLFALVLAAGFAAAVALTMPTVARAWDIGSLPAPYTIDALVNVGAKTGECQTFYVIHWYDQSVKLGYGPTLGMPNVPDCDPQFQTRLDAFVDATINLPQPPVTTTVTTSAAPAWDINSLPNGYTIVGHIHNDPCVTYQIRGYGAAIDLSDCRPDFQDALDAFVESTCPANICHPSPPVTTTVADTLPVTTTAPTDTSAPPVTVTDTTASTVPAPAPAPAPQPAPQVVTVTTVVETTLVDPTIVQRLDLLEQRQALEDARLDALEHPTGAILGELKNQTPFISE